MSRLILADGGRRVRLRPGQTELPREVFDHAATLEVLDLAGSHLTSLPGDLPRLARMRVIFGSGNPFEALPPVLGECAALEMVGFRGCGMEAVDGAALPPRLRWLTLTDNRLRHLPDALARRPALRKLMLAGNALERLPDLGGCGALELIRLSSNRLSTVPGWLPEHPALAWVALGGNHDFHNVVHSLSMRMSTDIPWEELEEGDILGSGASGVVHSSLWTTRGPDGTPRRHAVAIKWFRGAITSDGLPEAETAAALAAGQHPGLLTPLGRVRRPHDGAQGLVLPRLGPSFRPLADPPSLASCTRDVYAPQLAMPASRAARLAATVASAMAHLHRRGLVHGDLYAHNLHWDGADGIVLGDFGAAHARPADGRQAEALERLEVRAFGVLLDELAARCEDAADPAAAMLQALARRCAQPPVRERPGFDELADRLATWVDQRATNAAIAPRSGA
ncbi:MAG: hypothetical protein RL456_2298 [Pseudomonadota bacterium]|jgi:hypothetical protein